MKNNQKILESILTILETRHDDNFTDEDFQEISDIDNICGVISSCKNWYKVNSGYENHNFDCVWYNETLEYSGNIREKDLRILPHISKLISKLYDEKLIRNVSAPSQYGSTRQYQSLIIQLIQNYCLIITPPPLAQEWKFANIKYKTDLTWQCALTTNENLNNFLDQVETS